MQKLQIWKNQSFCFRLSVIAFLVWLVISLNISLILFFSEQRSLYKTFSTEFFIWLFILPTITLFGLINAIPLLLKWILRPVKTKQFTKNKNAGHSYDRNPYPRSHKSIVMKNKAPSSGNSRKTASYNKVANKLEQRLTEQNHQNQDSNND